LLALVPALSGCYLLQAVAGQMEVIARSQPIASVLAQPGTDPATRERLTVVVEAREFAVQRLDLPAGNSYRDYADLGRRYALWNVVVTPEFSVEARRWCFPFAGCVRYRGYFRESQARTAAARYRRAGDDVFVGGVAAYSTLGHFSDPILSAMLRWPETRLVGTLFHELAHEKLYVKDDSRFNEAFASVVEEEGVRLWLQSHERDAEFVDYQRKLQREGEFAALLREARRRLERLYNSAVTAESMRVEKQREFGRLKFDYQVLREQWGGYPGYDAWFAQTLSNADLAAVATYHDCVPGLRRELAAAGSLPVFYQRAIVLAGLPQRRRHEAVCRFASDPKGGGGQAVR
jgi:predicted aminopeptidase